LKIFQRIGKEQAPSIMIFAGNIKDGFLSEVISMSEFVARNYEIGIDD
jgi:hypothetical protein